jgi:16S rRNA C967 or C1407 C5-methylase (RsmB/RsmF family)/NOL1/NOP2/fmu family ribosome biogenesis protein
MEKVMLPQDFLNIINSLLPSDNVSDFISSFSVSPKTCIRLNPFKGKTIAENLIEKQSLHSQDVYLLKDRPSFIGDPGWHCGSYYVQELNSTRVGEIVRLLLGNIEPGCVVLDLCGAPGGKSTHISSVLRNEDLLIANEVIQTRNPILVENLSKWGQGNFIVTRADASVFHRVKSSFSIIAADMPCSGEGMFRKDNKAIGEWSLEHVKLCAARQQRIAEDIWPSLKPGGYFIYSTCTYNDLENEKNVTKLCAELGGELIPLPAILTNGSVCLKENMYRFYPHLTDGEGFFVAVIQKTAELSNEDDNIVNGGNKRKLKEGKAKMVELPDVLGDQWLGTEYREGEKYILRKGKWLEKHPDLLRLLPKSTSVGIPIGLHNKNLWKPSAAFDLLCNKPQDYSDLAVDMEDAIRYFQREFLPLKPNNKGIVGLRWNGLSLGTGNAVNNGINNLWPNAWRILQKNIEAKTILLED